MIEEFAIVVATDDSYAEVEPQRRSTCHHCAVQGACGTSLIDKFLGRRPLRLRVANAIGARVGERVILGVADAMLLRAAVAAYLLPLFGLMLGAALALELAAWGRWPGGDLWAVAGGLLGFTLALRGVAGYSRRLRADARYQPRLLERTAPLVTLSGDPNGDPSA